MKAMDAPVVPGVWNHPPRREWTRAEREQLEAMGLLNGDRWELIEGELLRKMPKNRPHVRALAMLTEWLMSIFGGRFVNTEAPIDVSPEDNPTSQPEPDLIVLRPDYPDLEDAAPRSEDLLLVVEFSDSTLEFDTTVKAELYARAVIREYWVLDLQGRRLIVHRSPAAGRYTEVVAYSGSERVSLLARPEARFEVARAFAR
jgi:Uma2 family endonuclease